MIKNKEMNLQEVSVEKMNPAPYNPRVDLKPTDPEYQHIKNSIESFGYLDPIVWNVRTGNIVSGHQRFKILKEQGIKEVDCIVVDFDEEKEKACNLAMNKASGLWDDVKVEDLLRDLKDTSWDMSDFGFESLDVSLGEDVKEDDFDIEAELKKPCFSQKGDVWTLGRHRVICGDSTLLDTFNKLLEGGGKGEPCMH